MGVGRFASVGRHGGRVPEILPPWLGQGLWIGMGVCWQSKDMLPKPTEKTRGPSASAASRPPGFRGGPQCSIDQGGAIGTKSSPFFTFFTPFLAFSAVSRHFWPFFFIDL